MKFEIIVKIQENPLKFISVYTYYKEDSVECNKAREMELKI